MKALQELVDQVDAGALSARGHLNWGPLRAYVRVTRRRIQGVLTPTIDVASVNVEPTCQQQGHFTRWLGGVETLAKASSRAVFVESVLNEHLARFLSLRGYQTSPDHLMCYYLMPPSV